MMNLPNLLLSLAEAAAAAQAEAGGSVPRLEFPLGEAVLGAALMAGLFVLFGLRAPAEHSGGCGNCAGDCGSCALESEDRI